MRIAIFLAALVIATPTLADTPATVSFSHGGGKITLTIPAHYCLPQGDEQTRFATETSAGMPTAQVQSVLLRCDRPFALETLDYIVIASPNTGALAMRVSRADMIRSTRAYLASNPNISAISDRAREKVSDDASKSLGEKVDVTGKIVPRGFDDDCVYLGGDMQMSVKGKSVSLIAAECLTSVNDHAIAVLRYRVGGDIGAMPALLAEAHAILLAMRVG